MTTRQEFEATYGPVSDTVFTLFVTMREHIAGLTAQVKELQDRLNKDSHNSSKPPSSDGYKKKPVSMRRKAGRKPGGQPGHSGSNLAFSDSPNEIVPHIPTHCGNCGFDLAGVVSSITERRQSFDTPPASLVCTEHQAHSKCCSNCGETTRGVFPRDVEHSLQYGPRFSATMLYLMVYQLVPLKRASEGHKANPPPQFTGKRGRPKRTVGGNLVRRLDDYREQALAFLYDFDVPFDNNLAERDIRMMKTKQKVSGCFRNEGGADAFYRIRGYVSTMRKQGHNVLDVLKSVCDKAPIRPDLTSA